MMSKELQAKVQKFVDETEMIMENLHLRWGFECEYEDINDYAKPFLKGLKKINAKIIRMTKRPFGIIFKIEHYVIQYSINSKTIGWKRIK